MEGRVMLWHLVGVFGVLVASGVLAVVFGAEADTDGMESVQRVRDGG
jgi:hypothetical protein